MTVSQSSPMRLRSVFQIVLLVVWSLSGRTCAVPLWKDVCTEANVQALPFCDPRRSLEERVADYTQRVPVEHQIRMMGNVSAPFEPLHIPSYQWWSEGLHGSMNGCVRNAKNMCVCPTSFPCPSGLASAFNTTLWKAIGQAIGREGRAITNAFAQHSSNVGDGLTYWSPNVNLQRDPRWGRNQEGEFGCVWCSFFPCNECGEDFFF